MKMIKYFLLVICFLTSLTFLASCSDDKDDDAHAFLPSTWSENLEKTQGQFKFQWIVDDEICHIVSYDFIFENKVCKAASFTVYYGSKSAVIKAWQDISF